jgi:hypothetical protein
VSGRQPSPAAGIAGNVAAFIVSGGSATALAAGWYPFRATQSNVEVALGLVILSALAGFTRLRAAVLGAVVMSAVGFTYFDTEPYLKFQISRTPDLVTAVLLLVVGLTIGETSRHTVVTRRAENSAEARLRRVQDAASRVARGEELPVLAHAVAGEIEAVLPGVEECWFSTDPIPQGTVEVGRDGGHSTIDPVATDAFALPVWALGRVVGYYVGRPSVALIAATPGQLRTATALADQVGAAFAVQVVLPPVPPPAPPAIRPAGPEPAPHLRVVRNT